MDFAEQVKSSVDIVKTIEQYVRLKKAGGSPRYTGLCPFHTRKDAVVLGPFQPSVLQVLRLRRQWRRVQVRYGNRAHQLL